MYRRQELLFIILVQAAVTLVLSVAEPNQGIVHPGLGEQQSPAFASHSHPMR